MSGHDLVAVIGYAGLAIASFLLLAWMATRD
jgi:hypothetical protein